MVQVTCREDLRELLERLNDSGGDGVVGVDQSGPFLIHLSGPYAEGESLLRGDPRDKQVDYQPGRRCEGCNAALGMPGLSAVLFPATVLYDAPEAGERSE